MAERAVPVVSLTKDGGETNGTLDSRRGANRTCCEVEYDVPYSYISIQYLVLALDVNVRITVESCDDNTFFRYGSSSTQLAHFNNSICLKVHYKIGRKNVLHEIHKC